MNLFSFRNGRSLTPQVEPRPHIEMPEVPDGSTVILEETNHAQIVGQPDALFTRRERVYAGADGRKTKVTIKNNLQAEGCGHSLTSPEDVGFISYTSKKPVCKVCEQEYARLREQTRHEQCVCRHLVAPHELSYIEGKGFVCEECKKKANAFKYLKVFGHLLLKPLIIDDRGRG